MYAMSRIGKSIEIKSGSVVARDGEWVCKGRMESTANGYSFFSRGDDDFLEFDGSNDWIFCEYVKTIE